MLSRTFLVLCALGLAVLSVSARSVEEVEKVEDVGKVEDVTAAVDDTEVVTDSTDDEEDIERGLFKNIGKYAQKYGTKAAKAIGKKIVKEGASFLKELGKIEPECLEAIYKLCKEHLTTAKKCAKNYLKEHEAECRKD